VHLARGQGDVGTAGVGNEEAVPVRVALEASGDQVELGGDAELALAVDEDLAPGLQVRDRLVERCAPRSLCHPYSRMSIFRWTAFSGCSSTAASRRPTEISSEPERANSSARRVRASN
jgi:hypothetical protein